METFVVEALYKMGAAVDAQNRMINHYTIEVNDPGYTLWEYWDKKIWGTDNHGWNGGPFALSSYAVGVRPTQAGYTTYQVIPQLGNFTAITAVVPTVKGNITVTLNLLTPSHFTMEVTSPANTTARIGIPRLGTMGITIKANDVTIFQNESSSNIVGLTYVGTDSMYVYFDVSPGSWNFDEMETPK